MNKKQLIVAWVIVILIVFILGLDTDVKDQNYQLSSYSIRVLSHPYRIKDSFRYALVRMGFYKYQLLFSTIFIGSLLIYTLRDKKK